MNKKQIKIRIFPDGRIESETVNIKGKECLKYIKDIEQITDAQVIRSEFTKEYYQSDLNTQVDNIVEQSNEN